VEGLRQLYHSFHWLFILHLLKHSPQVFFGPLEQNIRLGDKNLWSYSWMSGKYLKFVLVQAVTTPPKLTSYCARGWKSEPRYSKQVSMRVFFWFVIDWLLIASSHGKEQKRKEASSLWLTPVRTLIPFIRVHLWDLIWSQSPSISLTSLYHNNWGFRFQWMILGGYI
jgi:hypothetical protein